jgi:isoleucyl-tRNA synthetase
MEKAVLAYWEQIRAFETSNKLSEEAGRPTFTFYDGPPFATGTPHYGHILAMTIKDVVTRHAYSAGFHVPRRFGWDCHGLPVEHEIDKAFNLKTKDDVEAMGIATYNENCRSIVQRYVGEWKTTVARMGRWIDFDRSYKTMDINYMESVWWVLKTIFEKDLVYRGYKVMPFSTQLSTPLSNFEANLNYKMVIDPTCVVAFPLTGDADKAAALAWTTTPWTLPSNLALCVNAGFTYVKVRDAKSGAVYVLAKSRMEEVWPDKKATGARNRAIQDVQNNAAHFQPAENAAKIAKIKADFLANIPRQTEAYEVLAELKGSELVGMTYEPLFPYFAEQYKASAFRVIADDYVTDDSGTGIVHCAPAFGEDDNRVCLQAGITTKDAELLCPVDDCGRFTAEVPDYAGRYVKDADLDLIRQIKKSGRLVKQDNYNHSYPFCWRSDTPLIYKAVPSWFVAVEKLKERMLANHAKTSWVPENVGSGRFHAWLSNTRDWAISRSRYWGTPIPIWLSADGTQTVAVGSVAELERLSGRTGITDIHKHFIDDITIPDPRGGDFPPLKRIPDVFDCWFESGSMPYAQQHYPFENKDKLDEFFPAQFIAEGVDQTRGWFYTLLVLATALFDKPAFTNVVVNGTILAADGKKMSKRLKNYPDPLVVIDTYGADALRLCLINSPAVRAEEVSFTEEAVMLVSNKVIRPWWNAFRFAVENVIRFDAASAEAAAADGTAAPAAFTLPELFLSGEALPELTNVMDRWVMSSLQTLTAKVAEEMGRYRLYAVVPALVRFVDQLTNWYVKANRRRLKGFDTTPADCRTALSVLVTVLFTLCRLMAPITPFLVEVMYQHLKFVLPTAQRRDSVHYLLRPEPAAALLAPEVERAVGRMQTVVEMGRQARNARVISLQMPLRSFTVNSTDAAFVADVQSLEDYVKDLLTVYEVRYETSPTAFVRPVLAPNERNLGKKLGKTLKEIKVAMPLLTTEQIMAAVEAGSLTICGVEIPMADLVYSVVAAETDPSIEVVSENGIVCALNVAIDRGLQAEATARAIVSRVQLARKAAGLLPTDKVAVFYEVLGAAAAAADDDEDAAGAGGEVIPIAEALELSQQYVTTTLGGMPRAMGDAPADGKVISHEEVVVSKQRVSLKIVAA